MDIAQILKLRDIIHNIQPLAVSDTENVLETIKNSEQVRNEVKRSVKTVFGINLTDIDVKTEISVRSLAKAIKKLEIDCMEIAEDNQGERIPGSKQNAFNHENNQAIEIGVITASCRIPGGVKNPDDFWNSLISKQNPNKRIPANRIPTRDDLIRGIKYGKALEGGNFLNDSEVFGFDHSLFRISRSEAELIDPQQRLLLECVYECLENAGLLPDHFVRKPDSSEKSCPNQDRIGVFVGLMETEYPMILAETTQTGVLSMLGSMASVVAGRISYIFGCTGPTLTVDTACSSSLMAMELAQQSLKEGKCTKAIVAGVNLILSEKGLGLRANGNMLSEHGMCYSFDERAAGYGRADGCSVVLLEKAKNGVPYMGIIENIVSNHCGRGVSLTSPKGEAHFELISDLLRKNAKTIPYWEAHGTGTPVGDPIEMNVLSSLLEDSVIGSVKASIGHSEAAAGVTSLIKVLMMLKHGYVPPQLHFHTLNKNIDINNISLPVVGQELEMSRCGISSFGVSGTNVALIVRKIATEDHIEEEITNNNPLSSFYLLLISAKTKRSLDEMKKKVQFAIDDRFASLDVIASSLSHRPHYTQYRTAFIYNSSRKIIESFQLDKRDDWELTEVYIHPDLDPNILSISRIQELFDMQPKERKREVKLRLALYQFINEFSRNIQIRTMNSRDYILLLAHSGSIRRSENLFEDLEDVFTQNEVKTVLEKHGIQTQHIPETYDITPNEEAVLSIRTMRTILRIFSLSYTNGSDDHYRIIYKKPQKPVNNLNYSFDRQDIWFRERKTLFDHYLIGRKVKGDNNYILYENQLNRLRHPQIYEECSKEQHQLLVYATVLEIICAAGKGMTKEPFAIRKIEVGEFKPEDKTFLAIHMKKENNIWKMEADVANEFLFRCYIQEGMEEPKVSTETEMKIPRNGIRESSYTALFSQIKQMGFTYSDIGSLEIICFKELPTAFHVQSYLTENNQIEIFAVEEDTTFLKILFSRPDLSANEIVNNDISCEDKVDQSCQQTDNYNQIRKKILEALDDVMPDGLDQNLTESDTGFMDFGLDSLSLIDFVNRLNMSNLMTYEISTSDIFDFPSIETLTQFIVQKRDINIKTFEVADVDEDQHISENKECSIETNHLDDYANEKRKMLTVLLQALEDIMMEPLEEIDTKAGFMQLGLDSIAIVDFVNRLNERYLPSLNVTTSNLFEFVNLDELADHLAKTSIGMETTLMTKPSDFHLANEVKPPDENNFCHVYTTVPAKNYKTYYDYNISFIDNKFCVLEKPTMNIEQVIQEISHNSTINFDFPDNCMNEFDLFNSLCYFSELIFKITFTVQLYVQNYTKSINQLAISFFKTLSAEHFPKIMFTWPDRIHRYQSNLKNNNTIIKGNWLITGGLSGIGWACAEWLSTYSTVSELHLLSRRTPSQEKLKEIQKMRLRGVNIHVHSTDVALFDDIQRVFQTLTMPLDGIIHCAGLLRDSRIERQTQKMFEDVYRPKVLGFKNIDRMLEKLDMRPSTFLVMSSFTAVCGNIGQANYGVVNTIMDQLVEIRRRKGHIGTSSIAWGNWRDTGMASDPRILHHLEKIGLTGQTTEEALQYLKMAIQAKEERLLIAKIDIEKLLKFRKDIPIDLLCTEESKETTNSTTYNISIIGFNIFYDDENSFYQEVTRMEQFMNFPTTIPRQNTLQSQYVQQIIANSLENAKQKLKQLTCSMNSRVQAVKFVMMFSGQGSQYIGMARQYCSIFPTFQHYFFKNLQKAQKYFTLDLEHAITSHDSAYVLQKTSVSQPILLCFCFALYELWQYVGLPQPDFLVGHSIGELVAGTAAKMLTFDEALSIAVSRGLAMEQAENRGGLLAIDSENVYDIISSYNVHVSAWNSPNQVVIAGDLTTLEAIFVSLKREGKRVTVINDKYPFHSPLINTKDLLDFSKLLKTIPFTYSDSGIISCITGKQIHQFTEEYLMSHVTQPVNFVKCIETLCNESVNIWLEIGPGQTLSSLVQKTLSGSSNTEGNHIIRATCSEKYCDIETFVKTALDLEQSGYFINWYNVFINGYPYLEEVHLNKWPIIFEGSISGEEENIIKSHVVKDEVIIPAAFQLFKICEWYKHILNDSTTFRLSNIKFYLPWKLSKSRSYKLYLNNFNEVILEVAKQKITSCQISYKENSNAQSINRRKLQAECTEQLNISNYYKQQSINGTEYGSHFQLLNNMYIGEGDRILCKAHVKSNKVWPLIDASFHSVCPLMLTRRPDLIFIPVAINSIEMISMSELPDTEFEIWISSEIIEFNEKFIRVNSAVHLSSSSDNDKDVILFQGFNEMSIMEKSISLIPLPNSTAPSFCTNDCSSDQSESWPTDDQEYMNSNVGIVGYDCMFCHNAYDPESFWMQLTKQTPTDYHYRKRTSETSPSHRNFVNLLDSSIDEWDPEYFGVSPREAAFIDVNQRLLLKTVSRCMERYGITELPKRTAILVGLSGCDFEQLAIADAISNNFTKPNGFYTTGTNRSCTAGRLAHFFSTEGPAITLDTACSSSMTGIWLAYEMLMNRKCDMAVVAAVNVILTNCVTDSLKHAGMLPSESSTSCKAFDASANGYKRAEGVACVILTRDMYQSSSCNSDLPIVAKISSCNLGHNGSASALHVPNGRSQIRIMSSDGARTVPISHVECHGSGTAIGDVIEAKAIAVETQEQTDPITISSIKSAIGHTEAVSGLASLIAVLLQMQYGYRLPQQHISLVNRQLDTDRLAINFIGQESSIERIRVNNFGFSGTIGSLILEKSIRPILTHEENQIQKYYLVVISAKSLVSLERLTNKTLSFIKHSEIPLSQICTKLQKGRQHFRYRKCILFDFKYQIVWDSDKPNEQLLDEDDMEWNIIPDNETISFYFCNSLALHLKSGKLTRTLVNEFLKSLGSNTIDVLNPILFHKIIGLSYIKNMQINWKLYNNQNMDPLAILPSYEFNERRFWPFKCDAMSKQLKERSRSITFEKQLIRKSKESKYQSKTVTIFGISSTIGNFPKIDKCQIDQISNSILVFEPLESTVTSAMMLIDIWKSLDVCQGNVFALVVSSDETMKTEWTGLLRTLASEKPHPYLFISYENIQNIEEELETADIYEAIFYRNGLRYVERLSELSISNTTEETIVPNHLLITGARGGLANELMKYLKPHQVTQISRRLGQDVSQISTDEFSGQYDLICHCAGLVKNVSYRKILADDFHEIWKSKVDGFQSLERLAKKNSKILVFSSIATILGSAGQANYVFINGLMTSLAQKSSQNTVVFHLGPCSDVGMLAGSSMQHIREGIERRGWDFIESSEVLSKIHSEEKEIIVFHGDFEKIVQKQPHLKKFLFNLLSVNQHENLSDITCKTQNVREIIKEVSGLKNVDDDLDTPLMNLGIDSLMMEEIRTLLQKNFKISLNSTDLYENSTISKLDKLISSLSSVEQENPKSIDDTQENLLNIKEPIAVIGMSGSFSGSENIEEFWESLFNTEDSIMRSNNVTHEVNANVKAAGMLPNIKYFDHSFWKLSQTDSTIFDPQIRQFVLHSYKALDHAGYAKEREKLRIGVYAGAEPSRYGKDTIAPKGSLMELFLMNQKDFTASLTSHLLDLKGPAIGVYSACSTSLSAIDCAINSLRLNTIDIALTGAASIVLPDDDSYEYQEGHVLSKTGYCQPFDTQSSDGIVRGSAVGCIVLKRLSQAKRDGDSILAVIKSLEINNDGFQKASFMAPSYSGQTRCIQEALDQLDSVAQNRITYIECHGTGTRVGDEMELKALDETYGKFKEKIQLGSVKANIGHGFAAAGIASIIKCIKMLQTTRIPPQCHLKKTLNLLEGRMFLSSYEQRLKPNSLIAISSFGIGGTNGHLILEGVESPTSLNKKSNKIQILPISAKSAQSLQQYCQLLANYLEKHEKEIDLANVSSTLQNHREHHEYRIAISASTVEQAIQQLRRSDKKIQKSRKITNKNICFFFSPQGVLYPGFESSLLSDKTSIFSKTLIKLCEKATDLYDVDFLEILQFDSSNKLQNTKYGQVANFIVNWSIAEQLKFWSVDSSVLIGHSIGEYSAACFSNLLDEIQIINLLKKRGELCENTQNARMLTVRNIDSHEILLSQMKDVEISAILSKTLKCIVGNSISIEKCKTELMKADIDFKELKTDKGFHSSMMIPIEEEFKNYLESVDFHKKLTKPLISNVDGEIRYNLDAKYWMDHLRKPVRLDKCLEKLFQKQEIEIIIEIGPSGILNTLLEESMSKITVVNTMLSKKQYNFSTIESQLIQSLADLWSTGYEVNFSKIFENFELRDVNLPTYSFSPTVCWESLEEKLDKFSFFNQTLTPIQIKKFEKENLKKMNISVILEESHQLTWLNSCQLYISNIYYTEEIMKMTKISGDIVIYIPSSSNYLEPFFITKHLLSILKENSKLYIISNNNLPHHSICLGPLREQYLLHNIHFKFILNPDKLSLVYIISSIFNCIEDYIILLSSKIFSIEYTKYYIKQNEFRNTISGTILVFGGSGTIGSRYIQQLQLLKNVQKIIICNRENKSLKSDKTVFKYVDLMSSESIYQLLDDIYSEETDINTIIHAAGQSTSSTLNKTVSQMECVLKPKIFGCEMILTYLEKHNRKIENLILVSSLSSSLSIQGNDDYASSNIYFDSLASTGHHMIDRITSIQWPMVQDSGMASRYQGPLASIFQQCSINLNQADNLIQQSFNLTSSLAYSPMNPIQLQKLLIKKQIEHSNLVSNDFRIYSKETEEDIIRNIWKDILSLSSIDDNSNFFELGGNSLSALKLIWKLNDLLNIKLNSKILFDNPSLKQLINIVKDCQKKIKNKEIENIDMNIEEIPLSSSQEHMYVLHQMSHTSSDYNLFFILSFPISSDISHKILRYAINSLIAHQRSFRTVFRTSKTQVVYQDNLSLTESYQNLTAKHFSSENFEIFLNSERNIRFNINSDIPLRIIWTIVESELKIIFNQAHILTDGWSMTVLAKDLKRFYENHLNASQIKQPQYTLSHFALKQQKSKKFNSMEMKNRMNELQSTIPTTIRGSIQEHSIRTWNKQNKFIPSLIWKKIQNIARKHKTTEFIILLTAYLQTVRRWKTDLKNDEIVIGCPVSGRNDENQNLIGYFLNNIVININLSNQSIEENISIVEEAFSNAKRSEDIPFHQLVSELRIPRNDKHNPLFELYFNYRHSLEYPDSDIAGIVPKIEQISMNTIFDLSTTIDETPAGVQILLEYNSSKYSTDDINEFLNDILRNFTEHWKRSDCLNKTLNSDFPHTALVLPMFEQLNQTGFKTTNRIITSDEIQQISLEISNAYLINSGMILRPDDLIPLNMNRNDSLKFILAILETGAGYVPLDPQWPATRHDQILKNINTTFCVDESWMEMSFSQEKNLLFNRNQPTDVMYVIHTSGSTGQPKGVVIQHNNVMSFLTSSIRQTLLNSRTRLLNSVNTIFDVSISNIFGSLFASSTICLPNCSIAIVKEILKFQCNYSFITSAMINQLDLNELDDLKSLEKLVFGGETIEKDKLFYLLNHNIDILQIYGPTETTVWSTTSRCKLEKYSEIMIGTSNMNEICDISVNRSRDGEMIIKGSKVARGYIIDEHSNQAFNKCYHTSDYIIKKNNKFYYIGRLDDQVKIRGQLVQLKHVEETITSLKGIKSTKILMISNKMIAFYIGKNENLKEYLVSKLPVYMIPVHFIEMDFFPLNSSGKVDQNALKLEFEKVKKTKRMNHHHSNEMKSSIELTIRKMFEDLTGTNVIEDNDDFFTIGGHSLLLLKLQILIFEKFKIQLDISQLYQSLNIQSLAKCILNELKHIKLINSINNPTIIVIRETSKSNINIYFVHAVGGSVLPYYAFINIFPSDRFNLYGFEYKLEYEAETLKDLSGKYALEIAKHTGSKIPYLIGHSLGGIICREMISDLKLMGYKIPSVVMFDSWAVVRSRLSIDNIRNYAKKAFSTLSDCDLRVEKTVRLANMLRNHEMMYSDTQIYLFKSEHLGDASFRAAVRNELDELGARSMIANGLENYCYGHIKTFLINGDHESCMKLQNLRKCKKDILSIFENVPIFNT